MFTKLWMQRDVIQIEADTCIGEAKAAPEDHIIAAQAKVSAFMACNPVTVTAMTPMEEVATLLQKHKIGAIPVVDGDALIGIITESDLFAAFRAIMDGSRDDVRIEMLLDKKQSAFYKVLDCCKKFRATINSISLYGDYSSDQQLMTIRINSKQNDKLLDAIWDLGVRINQVTQLAGE